MFASALFTLLVALFSYWFAQFLMSVGLNRRVYNHVPGECTAVALFEHGVVDFDTAYDGTLFMSTGQEKDNRSTPEGHGRLMTYNVDNRSAWEFLISSSSKKKFQLNPGGISVSTHKTKPHLAVINHRKLIDTVEIFSYGSKKRNLKHLKTVKNRKFKDLVDVAYVDGDRFFATSHQYFVKPWLRIIESLFSLRTGSILFFDGENVHYVDSSVTSPAGIVYDEFRQQLFVASFSSSSILVYDVHEDFNITKVSEVPLETSPYYIWKDIDGSLLAACHPVKMRYLSHLTNRTEYYAPSQVLRLHIPSNLTKTTKISQLYANDGATLSAATAAVRTGNHLLIADYRTLLNCELPS